MLNTNIKVVYSLRIHIKLQQLGYCCVAEMKNPQNHKYNCWVYEATPNFLASFEALMKETNGND